MLLLSQITFFIDICYAISRIILYHLNYQFQQRPNVLEMALVIRNQGTPIDSLSHLEFGLEISILSRRALRLPRPASAFASPGSVAYVHLPPLPTGGYAGRNIMA